MKKVILLTGALMLLTGSSAYADVFSLSVGTPAPVYVPPPPVYAAPVYPAPVYPAYSYYYPTYNMHRHYYNWGYWHGRDGHRDGDHDRHWHR